MNVVQVNRGYDNLLTFTPTCVMKFVVEAANKDVLVFRRSVLGHSHIRRCISGWFTDISSIVLLLPKFRCNGKNDNVFFFEY